MKIPNIGHRHLLYSDIDFFALLGILTMPFDALRIFPLPMTYRPLGCLFLCLYFFLTFSSTKKYKNNRFIFFFVCILMIFVSFSLFLLQNRRFISFGKFVITIIFGFCSLMGLVHYFKKIVINEDNPIACITYLYVLSMQLPLIFGVIQLFQIVTRTYYFNSFFTTLNVRFSPGRVCISAAEPAAASEYLLLYLIIILKNKLFTGKKWLINKIIAVILFIGTFSMKGYLLCFLFFFFYKCTYLKLRVLISFSVIVIVGVFIVKLACNLNA